MGVLVGYFGEKNGVITYRICGSKDEVYTIIKEAKDMGHKFEETPMVEYIRQGEWTTLLKLRVPVGVAGENLD